MAASVPAMQMAGGASPEGGVAQGAEESGRMPEPTLLARLLATHTALEGHAAQKAEEELCEMQRVHAGQEELRASLKQLLTDKADISDYRTDLNELRASVKELHSDFKDLRAGKAGTDDLCKDLIQLQADVKELHSDFKELQAGKAGTGDHCLDLVQLQADVKELRTSFEELWTDKAAADDLCADFAQLRADVKELRDNFKQLQADKADVDDYRTNSNALRADVKELRTSFKDLRADVDDVHMDHRELQADVQELKADITTLVGCLERENPAIGQHLRCERAARAGACLDRILTQPHLAVPVLGCAGLPAWSAARWASKGVWLSCSAEGVQQEKLVVAFGSQIYAAPTADDLLRSAESLGLQSGSWEALPDNCKRCGHVGAVLAGCLYVCGGNGELGHTAVRYNPARDTVRARWERIASMGRARAYAAAAATRSHLYVCGGQHRSQVISSVERFSADNTVGARGTWEEMPSMLAGRRCFAAVSLREGILACGGIDQLVGLDHFSSSINVACSSEVLAPSVQVWTSRPEMALPRICHTAAMADGVVFVCGGQDPRTLQVLSSVETYNPSANAWSAHPSLWMTRPRAFHASAVFAGGLYLLGGYQHLGDGAPAESSVERLDLATSTCEELPPMLSSRAEFCCGVIAMGPTATS